MAYDFVKVIPFHEMVLPSADIVASCPPLLTPGMANFPTVLIDNV